MVAAEQLKQIIYVSETDGIPDAELEALLIYSRERNTREGVTGMLLVGDGRILQVLEGPDAVVDATYARIERDRRHHHCRVLWRRALTERDFGRWSMAFAPLSRERLRALPGFVDFFAADFDVAHFKEAGGIARFLLLAFREQ
jgi:hypothetical protein